MFTKTFWKQAAERAVKTFAQGLLGVASAGALGVLDVNWGQAASAGALAAVLSLLTSIVTSGIGQPDSPSAVTVE